MAAKKKNQRRLDEPKDATEATEPAKVAFQLRLDADTHQKLTQEAERAGVSLNQLIQGICRACSRHLIQGKVVLMENGCIGTRYKPKAVYFGKATTFPSEDEIRLWKERDGVDIGPSTDGEFWFGLDFSGDPVLTKEDLGK